MRLRYLGAAVAITTAAVLPAPAAQADDGWQSIGEGMLAGVSGIAVLDRGWDRIDALVVRDNKKPGQNRAVRVRLIGGKVTKVDPITWPGELPIDLESVEAVPGRAGEYIALASAGKGFHIRVCGLTAEVLGTFQVPKGAEGDNYESFALKSVRGRLFAVWADRGQDSRASTLYSAEFDVAKLSFGAPRAVPFRVSYPERDVRHASDLEITEDNRILISSASDPGDNGPFDSAVYAAGTLRADGSIALAADPVRIGVFPGHKIEALTCLSVSCGRLLYGTDDEEGGGSVRIG
ncbi:hypothetical protein SAMN05421504_104494 [Amycolatopsis xylanica]|uniref:Uncharacterized protein n=1 Tax=Amycolatopsis xylanica TaxID=589385 RepID=A0A1H3H2E1_9PSEU|nr:hypothetical protein [Amycolatopsis xylanica]SDY09753.1 hypothetical protein SAMN05421504_104494 [Amycolatopsis xylanica]